MLCFLLIKHEKMQDSQLALLQNKISEIEKRTSDDTPASLFVSRVNDGFDYLAIGNSITIHGITDYWWAEDGMAASKPEYDYYHRIVEQIGKDMNTGVYNYSVWEVQANDRAETYELLDKWLTDGIDLITVQLSENASNLTTFEKDFQSLLVHISSCCPSAHIIVIDDFWDKERHNLKKAVCSELGIDFVDLSDLQGIEEYYAGMGSQVWGSDGTIHTIEHEGVAVHPGDKAMAVIADRVLEKISAYEK